MSFDYKSRINTKINETVIGHILSKMTMDSVFFTQSTLRKPWAVSLPAIDQCMMFHMIIEGEAEIDVKSKHVRLQKGDFVLLPLGQGHKLFDGSQISPTPLSDLPIKIVSERISVWRSNIKPSTDSTFVECSSRYNTYSER